ncbi:MAG: 5'-3' exonuclease H3TH domain-containing protein [Eubacteriales bacterium]
MIDLKAIQGDASDCIPGVAGIGPKGAGELIQKYGSVSYLYDHLEELELKPAVRAKLEKSKENALLSYDLGTIRRDAPIDTEVPHYVKEAEPQKASALMVQFEPFPAGKFDSSNGLPAGGAPASERPQVRTARRRAGAGALRTPGRLTYGDWDKDGTLAASSSPTGRAVP